MDDKRKINAWVIYDWGNSAFATTIMAAVMPIYFISVAGGTDGSWSFTQTAAAIVVALLSPLLGAIADHTGRKLAFLRVFSIIGAVASACLAFVGPGDMWLASVLVVIGMVGFGTGNTFYDAALNDIASPGQRERVSARGYAMGYLGGGLLLAVNLGMILGWESIGLPDKTAASQISFVTVGIWWFVFSLPLFRNNKDIRLVKDGTVRGNLKEGANRLKITFSEIKKYPELMKFMVAYWFFFDGINTIIVMAASYGTTVGIKDEDLITALLLTQFIGFPATLLFGKLADKWGGKKMLYGSLVTYVVIVILGYFMTNSLHFFALACLVGLVQGGSQATSRAIFSKIIPPGRTAEFNGFLSFTSRFFSFGGPLVFGIVKLISDSSRSALLAVAFFFVVGIILLTFVNLAKGEQEARQQI
ncbi:MFS transporter [Cohnella cholangitidis]|uniref:MFS transporter n=1 Tax=Cohnella cholangitidis TaxID=2598458 RepID=A0A7G5BV52_9BACL|nr:MFS transporter [Cohnella cholangitidis]QMV40836.1 MFS transporter [Cohnella cholangitidis]